MESRAVSDAEKERKYEKILNITLRMYKRDRSLHTAAQICKEAGIAKGTLYLYFSTKEMIYMELLLRNFRRWHETLRDFVIDASPDVETLVTFMCRSLADFTDFVDLITVASVLIEEHLSFDYLRESKLRMRQETERTCKLLSKIFAEWPEDLCRQNMMRFYSFGIGYWRECFPSPRVMAALPEEFADSQDLKAKYFAEILFINRLIWGLGRAAEL